MLRAASGDAVPGCGKQLGYAASAICSGSSGMPAELTAAHLGTAAHAYSTLCAFAIPPLSFAPPAWSYRVPAAHVPTSVVPSTLAVPLIQCVLPVGNASDFS